MNNGWYMFVFPLHRLHLHLRLHPFQQALVQTLDLHLDGSSLGVRRRLKRLDSIF
jgi:hypothetical protein